MRLEEKEREISFLSILMSAVTYLSLFLGRASIAGLIIGGRRKIKALRIIAACSNNRCVGGGSIGLELKSQVAEIALASSQSARGAHAVTISRRHPTHSVLILAGRAISRASTKCTWLRRGLVWETAFAPGYRALVKIVKGRHARTIAVLREAGLEEKDRDKDALFKSTDTHR